MCRFVQWVLLKVNSQRFYKNALLSGLLPCLLLCVAVPWDLLSVCVTFSFAEPQCPHNEIGRFVNAGLWPCLQQFCPRRVAKGSVQSGCLSSPTHHSAHCTTPLQSSWSDLFQVTQPSAVPRHFFFFLCFVLLTLIIAVLHLPHNPPCFAYRAALLREYNRFQRPADAPKLYLPGRGGLSSTVCRLICRWHCVICQH